MKQTLRGRLSPLAAARVVVPQRDYKRQRPSAVPASTSGHTTTSSAGSSSRAFVLTHGGNLSILIMKCTLGGMLLLVLVQGTMWVANSVSPSSGLSSSSSSRSLDATGTSITNTALRGEAAKKKFEFQRDTALQQIRRLYAKNRKTTSTNHQSHPICQFLPSSSSATSKQLWMSQVGAILAASQHPEDKDYFFETWTKRLLSEISPPVLESSTTSQGGSLMNDQLGEWMGGVLDIVYTKLMQPDTASPLRIAVLGGSHTEGSTCADVSVTIPETDTTTLSSSSSLSTILANPMFCAWPFRLESFINTLAGFQLVEIVNLAEDGTDTAFMAPLVQNGIYPPNLMPHGPDIILHAYRQADYVVGSSELLDTIKTELTLLLLGRAAPHPCRSRPPLVVHLDDVTSEATTAIADLITIRPDEGIRRAIEADHQADPGSMAAHMALTWVTAFNMMDLTLQYCNSNVDNSKRLEKEQQQHLDNNATQCIKEQSALSSSPTPTCPFCFFASPLGTVRTTMELQHYIKGFVVHNDGWQVLADMSTGWPRKIGLVAMHPNANILFRVAQIDRPVRFLHIMTLRSNGDEWKASLARFRLAVISPVSPSMDNANSNVVATEEGEQQLEQQQQRQLQPQPTAETRFDVTGYHDSTKHMTYHFSVDMTQYEAPIGSDLMLSVELVDGSRFKILGLMLCS